MLHSLLVGAALRHRSDVLQEAAEPPIRSVVFGRERFVQHGHSLANAHTVQAHGQQATVFKTRVSENVRSLRQSLIRLQDLSANSAHPNPAIDWLLDNANVLQEQMADVRSSEIQRAFDQLPTLEQMPLAGLPRIYGLAWAWIAHSDSQMDLDLLKAYLGAYQEVRPLNLSELWALPITLRVLLLENLRRLAERVVQIQSARQAANEWMDQSTEHLVDELEEPLAQWRRMGVHAAFVFQLHQRESGLAPDAALRLRSWLLQHEQASIEFEQSIHNEIAVSQQSIRNAIVSLRQIDKIDWAELFEATSPTLLELAKIPLRDLEHPGTRARTDRALQKLARQADVSELTVARALLGKCTQTTNDRSVQQTTQHWLTGEGLDELRARLGLAARPTWRRCLSLGDTHSLLGHLFLSLSVGISLGLATWLLMRHTPWQGARTWLWLPLLFIVSCEAVTAVFNRLASEVIVPRPLSRLALDTGLTESNATLVVIPCMLSSLGTIDELLAQLEQHALSNRDPHALYALASDWTDAQQESLDQDALVLRHAVQGIDRLNDRHLSRPFRLFHRPRVWSTTEQRWMGWERKRGKLDQLLDTLQNPAADHFLALGEASRIGTRLRYLVTLDADTDMPPGALRGMVGVAAHPLNVPRFDASGRMVGGHAILQPRLQAPLPLPPHQTWYHLWLGGNTGLDPYAAASSEVYQDLFGTGTFTGKGLMDVQACHHLLHGRLPEAQVLSHDLLEGAMTRSACLTDVVLIEGTPDHPDIVASRMHRWTRGDWQLLPFLTRGHLFPQAGVTRWKLVDNLRRSLVAPISVLLLLAAMVGVLPLAPVLALVVAAFGAGPIIGALASLAPARDDIDLGIFYRHGLAQLARALAHVAWNLITLPTQAGTMLDAISRSLWRQAVSHRLMLEWTTAAAAQAAVRRTFWSLAKSHLTGSLAGLALLAFLSLRTDFFDGRGVLLALGLGTSWLLTPLWFWVSVRAVTTPSNQTLDDEQRLSLRQLASDTWRFFHQQVTSAHNDLPPDNVQFDPSVLVAARTSPTNIGLYLLATASAREMGEISMVHMVERMSKTCQTLMTLPRHRGHFFNWYDTRTLEVLPPAYVSTVDSGNLCGHLLAVAQACRKNALASPAAPLPSITAWQQAAVGLHELHLTLRGQAGTQALCRLTAPDMRDPGQWPDTLDLPELLAKAHVELEILSSGIKESVTWTRDSKEHSALLSQLTRLRAIFEDRDAPWPDICASLTRLAQRFEAMALEMAFDFLYDAKARLFHIGYRVDRQELDTNHYDMLASECRLASLLAIAKGDVPAEHWAALSRSSFSWKGAVGIRSWSGSMFEYLMPSLVMDEPRGSLLAQATSMAVRLQRFAARVHHTPWGVSESGIAGQDHSLAYQYGPQGTPELAVRRTPDDEWVVAPYATMMALVEQPISALQNLKWLEAAGARGVDGFFEALDYTPLRQVEGSRCQLVKSHMAHHQGMALLGIFCALDGRGARPWLMSHPLMRSVQALLHEKVPHEVLPLKAHIVQARPTRSLPKTLSVTVQRDSDALSPAHWVTNERLSALIDREGVRQLRLSGRTINRWQDVRYQGGPGITLLSRKLGSGVWLGQDHAPGQGLARFQPDRVVHERKHPDHQMRVASWIAPDDNCFVMDIELEHSGSQAIEVELMSYFEVTLTEQAADQAHPAFSKMFVGAHWWPDQRALTFERRPRHHDEVVPKMAHFISSHKAQVSRVRAGVSRADLLVPDGLSWRLKAPTSLKLLGEPSHGGQAVHTEQDPAASLACSVLVPADTTVCLSFCIATADHHDDLHQLMDKYQADDHVKRASNLSYTMASVRQHERQVDPDSWEAQLTLNAILASGHRFHHPVAPRLPAGEAPRLDRQLMWRFGLSGERPMVVVHIVLAEGIPLIRMLKRAMLHWNESGHPVDLVIVNGEAPSYWAPVTHQMQALTRRYEDQIKTHIPEWRRGVIKLLAASDLNMHEHWTLDVLASVRLQADGRSLAQQVHRIKRDFAQTLLTQHTERASMAARPLASESPSRSVPTGQFDPDTGAFRFRVDQGCQPSRPWSNVLANPAFGALVTHQGASFTWADNSNLHQITPWSNDALRDTSSELLVLQDMDTRQWWVIGRDGGHREGMTVTQQPGLTRIKQRMSNLEVEATWCVDVQQSVKQLAVRVTNEGAVSRQIRLVAIHRWSLGSPVRGHRTVLTDVLQWRDNSAGEGLNLQPPCPILLGTQLDHADGFGGSTAVSGWHSVEGGRAPDAFDWTCDLNEFINSDDELSLPTRMAQRTGLVGLPGAMLSTRMNLGVGETHTRHHLLVHGWDRRQALQRWDSAHRTPPKQRLSEQLQAIQARTQAIRVHSADDRFNALVNHWLPYQVLACRLWGRAGFYQAGGALGYRDQLQDAMALVGDQPELLARQIVVHASRQFIEGDVQHWWHPHNGAGVRTRFSDDLLWLPLALLVYLDRTQDVALLDQPCQFIEGRAVPEGKEDLYEVPTVSGASASVFEHAARALDKSLATGPHGLALMGCGDWNDGMNRVGIGGRGESVWLSWFLAHLLHRMAPIALQRGELERAHAWRQASSSLIEQIETEAWDGAWYRRAWFDDGTPLGSGSNEECRIDLIAQAWAVLSGLGRTDRARQAMSSAMVHLHDKTHQLTALLTPPLQHQTPSAGYIQAYPPGVRENGGQYSHAAVWSLMAMAELGEAAAMWSIFEGISPVHRQEDPALRAIYGLEPYAVAADIYTGEHQQGKGGWSWYTGSAGWLLRASVESICGVRQTAHDLCIKPCLPPHWHGIDLTIKTPAGQSLKVVFQTEPSWRDRQSLPGATTRKVQSGEIIPWKSLQHVTQLIVEPIGTSP